MCSGTRSSTKFRGCVDERRYVYRRGRTRAERLRGPNSRGRLLDFEVLLDFADRVRHRQLPLELLSYRRFNRRRPFDTLSCLGALFRSTRPSDKSIRT